MIGACAFDSELRKLVFGCLVPSVVVVSCFFFKIVRASRTEFFNSSASHFLETAGESNR